VDIPVTNRKSLAKIILPTVLTIVLFIISIFVVLIPALEKNMMDRKREMIRELTNSAWSVLDHYNEDVQDGVLSLAEAQQLAIAQIRDLRYGPEQKDYFWINDMQPVMVMHPYRTDLNGQDLSDFKDHTGKNIFVDFARIVRNEQEGYAEYMWQWKDDAGQIVPKISYVKGFQPWGWIIGTGIYVEDVRQEIAAITGRIVKISGGIIVFAALLLIYIARQSLTAESERRRTAIALAESRRKYKSLVEAATEGTIIILDGKAVYANKTMLGMLDYTREDFNGLRVDEFVCTEPQGTFRHDYVDDVLNGRAASKQFETRLRKQDGETLDTVVTLSKIKFAGRDGIILISKDISGQKKVEQEKENLLVELQAAQLMVSQPVRNIAKSVLVCSMNDSIRKAATAMNKQNRNAILVKSEAGEYIGVVTDYDLSRRVVAPGLEPSHPVYEVMSSPLISITGQSLIFEAILLMQENNVKHLVVKDEQGEINGIISSEELLTIQRNTSGVVLQEIINATEVDDVIACYDRVPIVIKSLIDSGATARSVTRLITKLSDAIARKFIDFAISDLGEPPCRFAYIALGSEGREEQTLKTDQDNALVFADDGSDGNKAAQTYFLALGKKISAWLDQTGYAYCKGNVMASNPQWCQQLSVWKKYFSDWAATAEPQNLLDASIFFDFRFLAGDQGLADELRASVIASVQDQAIFFYQLARNALASKPQISFFGKITVKSKGEHPRTFDVKQTVCMIIDFARIYALQHGVTATNTLERLKLLHDKKVFSRETYQELTQCYDYLMLLRFKHQVFAIADGRQPDNHISPDELSHIELDILKNILTQIGTFQTQLSFDFKGEL